MSMEEATLTPAKLSPRDRAEATDRAAKAIIDSEAIAREKKTEKLRLLRLEKEAAEPSPAPARSKSRKSLADH